jgi:hypothetical protein
MAKDTLSKRTRIGNTLISVTTEIETESAVIDYADILAATTVESDDDNGETPWDDCDDWEHTIDKLDSSRHTDSRPRNVCYSDGYRRYIRINVDAEKMGLTGWKHFHAQGASKGVAHQLAAMEIRRAIDQLVKWYTDGWQYYGVVCKFKDVHESVWRIDDYDYAHDEVRHEIAYQAATELERQGYEVVNRPDAKLDHRKTKRERLKRKLNLFNTSRR